MNSERSLEITKDRSEERGWLDLTGTAVSWACAIHCLALPFFVSLLPFLGLSFLLDETVEWTIIGVSILVAALSLLPAYFRQHRRIRTIVLFVSGVGLIVVAHLAFEENLLQVPFLLVGAIFITAAHLVNRSLCRSCASCAGGARSEIESQRRKRQISTRAENRRRKFRR